MQAAASSSSDSEIEGQGRAGLLANVLKPLRDFGIGRTSMAQGGVGLFVFSGIGACRTGELTRGDPINDARNNRYRRPLLLQDLG